MACARNPVRSPSASRRLRRSPSGSGVSLLKSGRINLGYKTSISSWNPNTKAKPQIHHIARSTEARKERVGMSRALAAIHHLNGLRAKPRSITERQQTIAEIALGQRGQFVEERQNQLGIQDEHQQLESEHQGEAPDPPHREIDRSP